MTDRQSKIMCCGNCWSQNIERDASASWSEELQVWTVDVPIGSGSHCTDCYAEDMIAERDAVTGKALTRSDLFKGEGWTVEFYCVLRTKWYLTALPLATMEEAVVEQRNEFNRNRITRIKEPVLVVPSRVILDVMHDLAVERPPAKDDRLRREIQAVAS